MGAHCAVYTDVDDQSAFKRRTVHSVIKMDISGMFYSVELFLFPVLFWSHSSTTHSLCVHCSVSCVGDDALEVVCSSGSTWRPRGCLCVNLVSQYSDRMGSYLHISYYNSQ